MSEPALPPIPPYLPSTLPGALPPSAHPSHLRAILSVPLLGDTDPGSAEL